MYDEGNCITWIGVLIRKIAWLGHRSVAKIALCFILVVI